MAVVVAASSIASIMLTGIGTVSSVAWLANSIACVLMLRAPRFHTWAGALGVFVGSLVADALVGAPPSASLAHSLVDVGYVTLTVWLIHVFVGRNLRRPTPRQFGLVLAAMAGCGVVGAVVFATISALALGLPLTDTGLRWFLANLVGVSLVAPLGLLVSGDELRRDLDPDNISPLVAWTGLCSVFLYVALTKGEFPFALAVIPLVVAATRLGPFPMSIAAFAYGATAVGTVVAGQVMAIGAVTPESIRGYQLALASHIILAIVGSLTMTQQREHRRRLSDSDARHRRAMWDCVNGMVNVSPEGKIIDANPAFARLFGRAVEEIEGKTVQEFTYPPDMHIGQEVLRKVRAGEIKEGAFQKRYLRRDGTPFWAQVTFKLLNESKNGGPMVLVSQTEDIDAQRRAEFELEELRSQWDFALASTGQGFWDYQSDRDTATYSPSWSKMLGYEPGEIKGTNDVWLELIHPDDRRAAAALDNLNRAGKVPHFEHEYRIRHKDGRWVWVLDRGKVVERNEDGSAKRIIGTLTDISQRKAAEEEAGKAAVLLADEKERLRVTLASIGDAVICTDADNRVTFMNAVAEAMTQVLSRDAIGRPLQEVYCAYSERKDLYHEGGGDAWHGTTLKRRDGELRAIREVVSPIIVGQVQAGQVIVFQDFTQMRDLQNELQHAAVHDGLTGVLNRSGFVAMLEKYVSGDVQSAKDSYLLYIDLDRFKAVNDTAGHAAGDAMLNLVARTLKETVRASDTVARLGGDEFGVLLRKCPESFARLAAQAIVDSIAAIEMNWEDHRFGVGASVGFASFTDTSSIDVAMARADEACYAAKAAGGGVVRLFKERATKSKKRSAAR